MPPTNESAILLVCTTSSNDENGYTGDCEHAIIELTPELIRYYLAKMAHVRRLHKADPRVETLLLRDHMPRWYASAVTEEIGLSLEAYDRSLSYFVDVPKWPGDEALSSIRQRTEVDRAEVYDGMIIWSCYPRHANVTVTSQALARQELLDLLCRCKHCGKSREEHGAQSKCLFGPTKYAKIG